MNNQTNFLLMLALVIVVAFGAYSYQQHEKNTSSVRIGDTTLSVTKSP